MATIEELNATVIFHDEPSLDIVTLAQEAGVKRNKLTHKHTGLKDLFYALVKTHHRQPAIVVDLQCA